MPSDDELEILEEVEDRDEKSTPPGAAEYMETVRRSEELSKRAEEYSRKADRTVNSVTFTNQS